MPNKVRNILIAFGVFNVCVILAINLLIIQAYSTSKPVKSDAIIVLGCQLWGESPSPQLKLRLEKALSVYKEGFAPKIIVTGGQGADETMPEAKLMKRWLIERGVAQNVILEEDKSTNTYENLEFVKDIMDGQKMKSAIVVTNDFSATNCIK